MEVQYIRLRNGDDIIASVEDIGNFLVLTNPMRVFIETILEEARQTVILDEYLPQKMIEIKSVQVPKEDVMFNTALSKSFLQDYETISKACYDPEPELPKKKKEFSDSAGEANEDKIISLLETIEAMKSKRGKILN